MKLWLEQTFSIQENNSSIKKEMIAGLTTFLAMAYITGHSMAQRALNTREMLGVY